MALDGNIDVIRILQNVWEEVCGKVNRSTVYIDGAAAESLHWAGGAGKLFLAGATEVKEFSSFEHGGNQRKAVFILSSPLANTTLDILRDIVKASTFQYIIVLTSLKASMHTIVRYGRGEDDMKSFYQLEDELLDWMGNVNYTVEIEHLPFEAAAITKQLFVLPSHSALFPLLPMDLQSLYQVNLSARKTEGTSLKDLEYGHLPKELQLKIKLLVCSLNSMLGNLSLAEDLYTLGHTSRIVASELAALSSAKGRRKAAHRKASLLLLDRSLDVASGVSHQCDTLLDKILTVLPKLPQHNNDVCVNMGPICQIKSNPNHTVVLPGCLAHPMNTAATDLLAAMVSLKHKEGLMEVNRQVVEAASREGLPLKMSGRPGRVTAEQLQAHCALFRDKRSSLKKNSGILQLVLAATEALRNPAISQIDTLYGFEKGLLQSVGEWVESSTILQQLSDMIAKDQALPQNERLFNLEGIFLLLLFIYSLVEVTEEVAMIQQERCIQECLVKYIMDHKGEELPSFLQNLVGQQYTKDQVKLILQDVFEKLRSLSLTREDFTQLSHLYEEGSLTSQASLRPLLRQVMEQILDPNKPEMPDVIYKSTGFRDLLKSGFGLFMSVSKPRPSDHPILIVFVVGGITATEIRQIKEVVHNTKTNIQVIVGSTRIITSQDLLHSLLVQDNLHPHCS